MIKKLILFALLSIAVQTNAQYDTVYVNGIPKVFNKKNGGNTPDATSSESPLKKDDYLFEFAYGYPFLPESEAKYFGVSLGSLNNNLINVSTNHIMGRVDYQLNDLFSVGLEGTYAYKSWDYSYRIARSQGTITTNKDTLISAKATKLRVLAKFSMHTNFSERFDGYITAGLGYKDFRVTYRNPYSSNVSFSSGPPIAVRLAVGGRFFLNPKTALNIEFGGGGPLMQIGLSFKFHDSYYGVQQQQQVRQ